MVGYTFHIRLLYSLLSTDFYRRFLDVPYFVHILRELFYCIGNYMIGPQISTEKNLKIEIVLCGSVKFCGLIKFLFFYKKMN